MPDRPLRAVLDANVLISARIAPGGTTAALLQAAEDGLFEIVVSERVLEEVRAVLARPKMRRYLEEEMISAYLDRLRELATVEDDAPGSLAQGSTPDPEDDYLVGLTSSTRATCLISGDAHLLGLPDRAWRDGEGRLLARVTTPREFLDELEGSG